MQNVVVYNYFVSILLFQHMIVLPPPKKIIESSEVSKTRMATSLESFRFLSFKLVVSYFQIIKTLRLHISSFVVKSPRHRICRLKKIVPSSSK